MTNTVRRLVDQVNDTLSMFGSHAALHRDPSSLETIRETYDRMIHDLFSLTGEPTASELSALCQGWQVRRIKFDGATRPPDLFIEMVCQAIDWAQRRGSGRA